jgi:hypothetical protein
MRSKPLASLDESDEFLNCLFYGKEGSGKTTAMAEMANFGSVVIINAEAGLRTRALRRQGIETSNIRVYPDRSAGEKLTFDGLKALYERLYADLLKDPNAWAGIGMDSITDVTQSILDEVSGARTASLQRRGEDTDPWWTDRDDYNGMGKRLRYLLRRFRDLPCHFVVTALERRDLDEDSGTVMYGPAVSPSLATDLLGYVDLALAFKGADEEQPFRAATSRARKYRVKDRDGVLPPVLANPRFGRLLDYYDGVLTKENDPDQALIKVKKTKAEIKAEAEVDETGDERSE